jgi:hypothetical protein
MYLDTVTGKQDIPRTELARFRNWESTANRDTKGEYYKKYYKQFPVGDFASIEIFAERRFNEASIGFNASLPKFKYDNNVQMLLPNDLEEIADGISNLMTFYTGIDFDALNARLSRADIAFNFQLMQDQVHRRIAASKLATYSRKHTRVTDKEKGVASVYYGRENYHEIYLYSKHDETNLRVKERKASDVHLRNSIGILRLENSRYARKLSQDAKRLGLPNITLATFLDPRIAEDILIDDMKKLLLDRPIAGRDEREAQLENYCGDDTAKFIRLLGFMHFINENNEKRAVEKLGYHYTRRGKLELIEAGVWLSAENRLPLPALATPNFEDFTLNLNADCGVGSNTLHQFAPVQTFIN